MSVQTNVRIITNLVCNLAGTTEKSFRELEHFTKTEEIIKLISLTVCNFSLFYKTLRLFLKRFIKAFYMHLSSKLLMQRVKP